MQEEQASGYIRVAVTGYESRGTGKEQHIVWLLNVTRIDQNGNQRQHVLYRRYSGIHQFNEHLLKTIVDQAHLCPLPPTEAAVYWQLDHTLWLHPAPQTLNSNPLVSGGPGWPPRRKP